MYLQLVRIVRTGKMAGSRVTRCLVVYCVAFAAAAIASRADGGVYEKIPLGAIFEQGSDEVQTAFKLAVFKHNQNNTERRFELQAYVDVIKTADAFKLSKLNVTGTGGGRATTKHRKPSRWFGRKPKVGVDGGPAAVALGLVGSDGVRDGPADGDHDSGGGGGGGDRSTGSLVTVTRVQDQTIGRGTLRCRSFTPRTAVRPRSTGTRREPRPSTRWACALSTCPQHSETPGRRRAAVTLPTCARPAVADPMTKWFMKVTAAAGGRVVVDEPLRCRGRVARAAVVGPRTEPGGGNVAKKPCDGRAHAAVSRS